MYLAVQGEGLSTIAEIAKSYGISQNHLVKVAHRLALEGYVSTTRGKNGGLRLARPAAEINVGEVVRRMEPDMALVPCMQSLGDSCPSCPTACCSARWKMHVLRFSRCSMAIRSQI